MRCPRASQRKGADVGDDVVRKGGHLQLVVAEGAGDGEHPIHTLVEDLGIRGEIRSRALVN